MYCAQRRSSRAFGCFDDDKDGSHYYHLVNHPLHDDPMGVEHGSRLVHLPGHEHAFCLLCPPNTVFPDVLYSTPIAPKVAQPLTGL